MNKEYILKRTTFTKESTIGEITLEGKHVAYCLEDVVRKPGEAKVYGKTAIPAGRYQLVMTMSNRFKKVMPLLVDVPGFQGIRVHSGNTSADTEGCLILGTTPGKDFVGESRKACTKFYAQLKKLLDAGNQVWITVK